MIDTSTSMPLSGAGQTLARNTLARLNSAYPAFDGAWRVTVNESGGTLEIRNLMLSGRMGCLLHINRIDYEGRKAVLAGGELLERYKVSRAKALDIMGVVVQRDRLGELVYDR